MIVTVTLNPAIDKTMIVNDFTVSKINRVNLSYEDIGGKGINVSKVIKLLGGSTLATGFLGGDTGKKIKEFLCQNNISEDFVDTGINTRVNIKIIDPRLSTTTELNDRGLAIDLLYINKLKQKIMRYSKQSNFIVFCGSAPKDFDLDFYEELIKTAGRFTKVVVDADGEMLKKAIKAAPFMIKPNIEEFIGAFNLKEETNEAVIHYSRKIIHEYGVRYILISKGKEGSLLISEDKSYKAMPIQIEAKNTVGAGDSMLGSFLYRYEQDENIQEALKFGVAGGTAAVMIEGTKVFEKEVFNIILDKVKLI